MEIFQWTKVGGVFFEAGAADGIHDSSTLKLEIQFGWTGLLMEADPDNFNKLLSNDWRNSQLVGTCISRTKHPEVALFDKVGLHGSIIVEGTSPSWAFESLLYFGSLKRHTAKKPSSCGNTQMQSSGNSIANIRKTFKVTRQKIHLSTIAPYP